MFKKQTTRVRVPIVICIDIEPDNRVFDPHYPQDWLGFEAGWEPVQRWRAMLMRATNSHAHFNWFVRIDPQIEFSYGTADWALTRYQSCFSAMVSAGDEVGLHPHSWRWCGSERQWIADFGDQAWIEHCVRKGFDHFERRFGKPCRSFRFGDRWLNDPTVELLERLGTKYDLTIEPGRDREKFIEAYTGELPDYTNAPRSPYHPAKGDFMRRGDAYSQRDLWHIPVSTASLLWDCSPLSAGAQWRLKAPGRNNYEGFFDGLYQTWLYGWVYDSNHPAEIVHIDLYDEDNLLATYAADFFREDLLRAGKGSGAHGFLIPVPPQLRDGRPHKVHIRVAGSSLELNDSPRTIMLNPGETAEEYQAMNLATGHERFRRLCDTLLYQHEVLSLTFVVRTDAFLTSERRAQVEQNLNYLATHPRASDFVLTTPAEALELLRMDVT